MGEGVGKVLNFMAVVSAFLRAPHGCKRGTTFVSGGACAPSGDEGNARGRASALRRRRGCKGDARPLAFPSSLTSDF